MSELKCPKCGSKNIENIGTYEFRCFDCGHKWFTLDVWSDKNESDRKI